ncbi:MAG: hydrogenase maturation nickel metallochaperone HypA [Gammaproteobacteria bacterium]|nr:hydrogenase maturation nickel metallochaperone HypA [Gammaproteobacteria bacterium]
MHELSIWQNIIEQVTEIAKTNNAPLVTKIIVQTDPLSDVESGLLEQAYPIGSVAQNAN